MHYFICFLFGVTIFQIIASGNAISVPNDAVGLRSGEGNAANEADECKKCKMPKASQMARLILMNALNPPYAALQVPSETLLLLGSSEHVDFHSNSSRVSELLDGVLASPERRQFARSVLKNVGEIGTTELLEDCCWAVQDHVCFALHSEDGLCSAADADHILTASSLNGECALVLQQANDEVEMEIATAVKGQLGKAADQTKLESTITRMFGPKKIRARVSDLEVEGINSVVTEFEASTTLPVYERWTSLASLPKCQRVFMLGFSLGSGLAQYHRFDNGVFRNDGLLSDTCKFGGNVKECSTYLFGTMFAFQGNRTIELATCAGDYSFITEDDLVAGLPELSRTGIFCPSCQNTLKSDSLQRFAEFFPLAGMKSYQLRRNLGVWLSSNPPRVFPYTEAVEVPCKESSLDWMKTPTYIKRNESYTHGPLGTLSHPSCVDLQYLAVSQRQVRSTSCGHYCQICFLWVELLLAEEAPDISIPMPPASSLRDVYYSAALLPALVRAAVE